MKPIKYAPIAAIAALPTFGLWMAPLETGTEQGSESAAASTEPKKLGIAEQAPFGQYLADAEGRALYIFTADQDKQSSTCYEDCAVAWPPVVTHGDPRAAAPELDGSKLGTTRRRDGQQQVTYNGWPLYYYAGDEAVGQAKGQDVHGFGGEWYLISPDGEKIEATEQ